MNNNTLVKVLMAAVVAIGLGIFAYLRFSTKIEDTMYVKSIWWQRVVYEKEDYYTSESYRETETYTDSQGRLSSRTVTKCCRDVRHTRVIKECRSDGRYPDPPYWAECPIGVGHYRTEWAGYYAALVHNGEDEYRFRTWYVEQYNLLRPEQIWCAKVNRLNQITALNHPSSCKEK